MGTGPRDPRAHVRKRYWERYNKRRYAEARAAVVAFLGGRCERCECDWLPFEIHHVNGDGYGWEALPSFTRYKRIMDGTIPREGVALLCLDCHPAVDTHAHPNRRARRHQ